VGSNVAQEHLLTDARSAFLSTNATTVDTSNYPVAVPQDAENSPNYSYEVFLRWKLTGLPDNYLQNFKVYGPSTQPADSLTVMMGTTASFINVPVEVASSVAIASQHIHYINSGSDYLSITLEPADNKLNAADEKTYYCVAQLCVEDGASTGNTGVIGAYTLAYEEV
jgi:hypothetical protein